MTNNILQSIGTSTAFTITLDSLADGAGRVSAPITDGSPSVSKYMIFACSAIGASAPDAGSLIKFYLVRADDASSEHRDGGVGAGDTAISNLSRFEKQAQLVHVQVVEATDTVVYKCSFVIEDPGTDWQIAVVNHTGQALASSGSYVRYRTVIDQIQ